MGLKPVLPVMPPSLELVTGVKADLRARKGFVGQEEVGILGYAGDPAFKGVRGVIKQR
jgi:tRNA pseudouridine13 synthase